MASAGEVKAAIAQATEQANKGMNQLGQGAQLLSQAQAMLVAVAQGSSHEALTQAGQALHQAQREIETAQAAVANATQQAQQYAQGL